MTNRTSITTPEGINITLSLAGPGSRFLALCIDYAFIFILAKILSMILITTSVIFKEFSVALLLIAQFVISWGYFISFEWLNRGQSPGKKLFDLRVVDKNGYLLKPDQIILRNLFRVIDAMPLLYLIGGTICMLSQKYQRIGDLIASTIVIYDRHFSPPQIEHIAPDKFNSFYTYPHLIARARQQITPQEASMIVRSLLRRDKLIPENRIQLYRKLTCYLKSIVNFPVEHISDEQYLKNYVEILYSRKRI